jgi:hypothetical protein
MRLAKYCKGKERPEKPEVDVHDLGSGDALLVSRPPETSSAALQFRH